MNASLGYGCQYFRSVCIVSGMLVLTQLLGACASGGTAPSSDFAVEVITPSDESELRRRARIRLELSSNYFEAGQTAIALDEVKQALVADSSYADAYNLRGLIYLRLNDFVQAEDSFQRALSLRPSDPNVLHNYGWLLCQQQKYPEADKNFIRALGIPVYQSKSKTWMARGLCQSRSGQLIEAEQSLLKAYELDTSNPVVGYNLALLLFRQDDRKRAQFYIRRLNNTEFANAESLWLGIKVEHALNDSLALQQLAGQLRKRFPDSREWGAFERGAFNE
ncbi:MAG: type IV pilus biogenesis/stability protein PilW [Burkholderiaceae bacterium]|nr:type IV pilus biogenesis/stability protein PilW [Burkholderiaceae bacterium]